LTTNICIYGTVFNNVSTVEESIKSIWRPEFEIVIIDNYSTDGTWEKLLELKKDYNLRIYRYRCSRGLGRYIALYKCSEKTTTTWFDLDTIYMPTFHKAIEYALETGSTVHVGSVIITRRESILNKGGWKDLNYGEDVELISRVGFDVYIPVVIGINESILPYINVREKRYGGLKRIVKVSMDLVRGNAFSISRILINRSKRAALSYIPAKLLGFYKNRDPDNPTWIELRSLARIIPLKDVDIDEEFFHMKTTLTLIKMIKEGEKYVDDIVLRIVSGDVYKFYLKTREFRILYYKNPKYLEKTYLPLIERIMILKK